MVSQYAHAQIYAAFVPHRFTPFEWTYSDTKLAITVAGVDFSLPKKGSLPYLNKATDYIYIQYRRKNIDSDIW